MLRCTVLAVLVTATAALADGPLVRPPVTVFMVFEGDHSDASIEEMKREASAIMGTAGLVFEYKLRSELSLSDTPADLVLVKFRGRCRMETLPPLMDERGPFAVTSMTGSTVLPFSEVACDRVRNSVRRSLQPQETARADRLFGRALGRVLAHELYHIVAGTTRHGKAGVGKTALSGRQLIADELGFDPAEIERMHEAH